MDIADAWRTLRTNPADAPRAASERIGLLARAKYKAIWVKNGSAPGTALRLVAIPFELRHVLLGHIEPLLANIDAYHSL